MLSVLITTLTTSVFAADVSLNSTTSAPLLLQKQSGFFRLSFDNIKMPQDIQNMGLLGITYYADVTPLVYAGIGGYGSITGTQGGLFVLGFGGGLHKEFWPHWWGDAGLYVGGGGGRSSLVGGGLMLRPYLGLAYSWSWARLGIHYSYVDFPSGEIHSQQIGLDLDIPCDFYYVPASNLYNNSLFAFGNIHLPSDRYLAFQRNDFSLILQSYNQTNGTRNVNNEVQDGTIGLVGAELDHYLTEKWFWWIKTSGAFSGNPNGYMDVLGGLGYHWITGPLEMAVVPQLGAGAGGGGNVDTGGGILIQPQIGLELPLTHSFAARASGGYLWAPDGNFKAVTATGAIIYHLDIATAGTKQLTNMTDRFTIQGWRVQLLNQTYIHPQRSYPTDDSAINLVALQIDQFITPLFFFSYQAASAYSGDHSGGYASGMIGPGIQTPEFFNKRLQAFAELLVGAGGGGSLALGGGAIIEPLAGVRFAFTPAWGLQASIGQLKALHNDLNTPVVNVGLTLKLGTLNRG